MMFLIPFFVLQICCISLAASRTSSGKQQLSSTGIFWQQKLHKLNPAGRKHKLGGRRPYLPYRPYPHRHRSVCPKLNLTTVSVPTGKPAMKIRRGKRSARRTKEGVHPLLRTMGTVAQYDISKKRQFLGIGVPLNKARAMKQGRSGSEGKICVGSSCYRPQPQGSKCLGVDLTFIMDCSGSINSDEWKQLSRFVRDTAAIFDVHPDSTRVAAINFGSQACVQFHLGTHDSNTQLYLAIDKIPKCGGSTHLAEAMNLAVEKIYNRSYEFDRPNVLNLCLVFTDGQANGPGNVDTAAENLRRAGCEVYAIGIGNGINHKQLLNIAGEAKGKVVLADDFKKLLENRVFCKTSPNSIKNS